MRTTATITEIEELAPGIRQITISFTETPFHFRSGQWVNFHFPDGVSRAYTIASAPQRPEAVQLCVRVGVGRGSQSVQRLEAGGTVRVDGPYGDFVAPSDDGRPLVFLAGDTGIAPVRSIVLDLIATNDERAVTVLYEPDHRYILYAADFDPLARAGRIVHESGPIDTLIERNRKALNGSFVMAVGFDSFLDRTRGALEALGIDWREMIMESFGPQP
ncbi:MAG TPA: FAD-dependent oxidoreductase [Thermoanaerobaculia bacterium]